jgi:hypothetical protein
MAVARKTQTVTMDLMLILGSPHNPCPLVHPLLSFVPNPTNNPAMVYPM